MKVIQGKVEMDDNGHFYIGETNLSSLLDTVYCHPEDNKMNIKILDGCKTLFQEDSILYIRKSECGIYDYYISGNNLTDLLFHSTGKTLEIIIRAEALVA